MIRGIAFGCCVFTANGIHLFRSVSLKSVDFSCSGAFKVIKVTSIVVYAAFTATVDVVTLKFCGFLGLDSSSPRNLRFEFVISKWQVVRMTKCSSS